MTKVVSRAAVIAAVAGLIATQGGSVQGLQLQQTKTSAPGAVEPASTPTVVVASDQDYRIGPRDVIEVRVADAEELSMTYEVAADGTFLMTYLNRVRAEGKTPDELARFVENGLRGGYLKAPHVSVVVKQFNSHTFFVQGSVAKAGVYQIEGRPSLFKLISIAGGLTEGCGTTAFIFRETKNRQVAATSSDQANKPPKPDTSNGSNAVNADDDSGDVPEYTVIPANIAGLLRGRLDQNIFLEPGDIVSIPRADVFYVTGEVNAPGMFPLGERTTIRQAMALSQGMSLNAKGSETMIERINPNGQREEIKVDLSAIMKNHAEDVPLQANDVVIVPNSRGKAVLNTFLKAFGMSVAQRGMVRY